MRKSLFAAVVAVLGLLGPLPQVAQAHPLPHGDSPRIVDLTPAPGSVLAAGEVAIRALAIANQPLTEHRVLLDGEPVDSSGGSGSHQEITATARLDAGVHTVEVVAATAAGEQRRAWSFHVSPLRLRRLSGEDRVATAAAVSQDLYREDGSATAAVLARADAFPDALAGAPLAHASGGPLLLTRSSMVSDAAEAELRRVLPAGATVYLLGGEQALAPAVERRLADLGFDVERVAGDNRYATAVEVARRLPPASHAVLASGEDFADALAASSPAAMRGWPVLLTRPGSLPAEVATFLREQGTHGVHVVGGGAAVSGAVSDELAGIVSGVSRTGGATRYETAAAVGARFFDEAAVVGVASGTGFADALTGGVHAAALEAPLLLASSTRLFDPQLVQLGELQPQRADLYGGRAVLATPLLHDLLRGPVDAGAPLAQRHEPTGTVRSLDEVVVVFDRDVDPARSTVYLTVGGHEVTGSLGRGEFANELVLRVEQMPEGLEPGRTYEAAVTVEAADAGSRRHHAWRFAYFQPFLTLSRGDSGPEVTALQRRLRDAGYWVGTIDGRYGSLTHQAVLALQKAHGLPRDGAYDEATRRLLESNPARPRPRSGPGSGFVYEIDLARQILMVVRDGSVQWVLNTSTGHGRTYTFGGRTYRATTTTGQRRVVRQIDGMRTAERGQLWRPKYFDGSRGIAIHGSTSVPEYPASAGCVRVTYAAMNFLWSIDPNVGAKVWVYPENHYN